MLKILQENYRVFSLNAVDEKRYVNDPFNRPVLGKETPWKTHEIIPCEFVDGKLIVRPPYCVEVEGDLVCDISGGACIQLNRLRSANGYRIDTTTVDIVEPNFHAFDGNITCERLFVDGNSSHSFELGNIICDEAVFASGANVSKIAKFPKARKIVLYLNAPVDFSSVQNGLEIVHLFIKDDKFSKFLTTEHYTPVIKGWHYLCVNSEVFSKLDLNLIDTSLFGYYDDATMWPFQRLNEAMSIITDINHNKQLIYDIMMKYVDKYPDYEL